MRFGRIWIRITIPCLLLLAGCGVLESTRELEWQNRDAGDQLSQHPDPVVGKIGADIRANSDSIMLDIKEPKVKTRYSHDMSATLRNTQAAQLAARRAWWDLADQGVAAAATFFGVGWIYTGWKALRGSKVTSALVKGIETLEQVDFDKVKSVILPEALKGGVSDALHSIVKKVT